jgi:uncharacterized FlaG/YvyC family protein
MEIVAAQLPAVGPESLDANAGQNRDVARAVRILNDTGAAGPGREFSFSIDPKTKLALIRILDPATREVIDQVPSEYILQVARDLEELRSKNAESVR